MTEQNQEPSDLMEILAKYAEEYGKDTYIDELRLREALLKIAGIKGKWITYKAMNTAKLIKLKKQQQQLLDEGIDIIKQKKDEEGNPVSRRGAEMILKNTKKYRELDERVESLTALVTYFVDSVKAILDINWDIKNLIDNNKMEEM